MTMSYNEEALDSFRAAMEILVSHPEACRRGGPNAKLSAVQEAVVRQFVREVVALCEHWGLSQWELRDFVLLLLPE
jgi:hypothetical protein